jgi:hypothetical protein
VHEFFDDEEFAALQNQLMAQPEQGTVMPGCGGLRKSRIRDLRRRKGKRGGARLIYLHIPEVNWIFLLDIYGKGEEDDLNVAEKKVLIRLANEPKVQALRSAHRTEENTE